MSWMHTPSARALSARYILYNMLCAQEGLSAERPPHHHHPGRAYGFSNQHGSSNGERAHTRERERDSFYVSHCLMLFIPHSRASLFLAFYILAT